MFPRLLLGKIKMTVVETSPHFADCFDVPTFYVTHVVREDAGDGNIRVWNCIKRAGVLIPSCEVIVPASRLVMIGQAARDFAQQLCRKEILVGEGVH